MTAATIARPRIISALSVRPFMLPPSSAPPVRRGCVARMRRGGCGALDAGVHGGCTRGSVGTGQMEISILGSLEAREGTRILDLGGGKQRALLANLAIHRGQLLGPDRLIDDLWGDRPPPSAAKTLQVLISRLRKTLGRETIVTRGGGYMLAADGVVTDVEQLEALLRTARDAPPSGDATAAAEHTAAAAGLFRARPL